jgi:hypothetical protein
MIAPRFPGGGVMHRSMHTLASARCCCAIMPSSNSLEIRLWPDFGEVAMTFAIHASKARVS